MGVFSLKFVPVILILSATMLTMGIPLSPAAEVHNPRAYFELRFMRSPILHVDDQKYEIGWFEHGYTTAARAFESNPIAQQHFDDYLTEIRRSKYALWASIGASLTFIVMDSTRWHLPARESSLIHNSITIGGVTTSLYFASLGGLHLGKALNIYNRHETAQKSRSSQTNFSLTPIIFPGGGKGKKGPSGGIAFKMDLCSR